MAHNHNVLFHTDTEASHDFAAISVPTSLLACMMLAPKGTGHETLNWVRVSFRPHRIVAGLASMGVALEIGMGAVRFSLVAARQTTKLKKPSFA